MIDRYETRLSQLGLPARLIPRGVGQHELKGALVESLARLPPAPSVPAGGLGVVIAMSARVRRRCCSRATSPSELGLDPDDVVLATRERLGGGIPAWLQMSDAGDRRGAPAELAAPRAADDRRVQPAAGRPRLRWAREILDNLEPTITWAIVDAGAKREDIAHRVDGSAVSTCSRSTASTTR